MVLLRQSVTLNYTPAAGDITFLPMGSGLTAVASGVPSIVGDTLLTETFEDTSFASRGWYDGANFDLDFSDPFAGVAAADFTWQSGNASPDGGSGRIPFVATDRCFVQTRIKFSANWEGSGSLTAHPHIFHLLTNQDSAFVGPNLTRLDILAEVSFVPGQGIVARFAASDSVNIDQGEVGNDITAITEQRGAHGCNGFLETTHTGTPDCFGMPAFNGRRWDDTTISIIDSEKVNWHKIGWFVQLNTIVGGIGQQDGILRIWVDDVLKMDFTNVVLRTGEHSAMLFNQLLLAPFMNSSPATQSLFLDDLVITRDAPLVPVPPQPPPGGVPDLVNNASFETDFDGWLNGSGGLPSGFGGATIARSTEQAFDGSWSAKSFMPAGGSALQFLRFFGTQTDVYMRLYYYATNHPNDNHKWIRFQLGFGNSIGGLYTNSPGSPVIWAFQNSNPGNVHNPFNVMGPIGNFNNAWHSWEINYDVANARVRFWFDDVVVVPTPAQFGNNFVVGDYLHSGGGFDGNVSRLNIDDTTNGGNSNVSNYFYDRIALSTQRIGP